MGVASLKTKLRYAAPNLITGLSVVCAVLAVQAALRGEYISACWWVLYSTLTDKLDGMVARLLDASSALGVQMDSLADLLNYGFVPAAVAYGFFHDKPELGWSEGPRALALIVICCFYALCAAVRLARFNVSQSNPDFFFGTPTTFAGAMLMVLLVSLAKYGDPRWTPHDSFPGWRLLDGLRLDGLMEYYPLAMLFLGWAMVSSWRVPKAGKFKNRFINLFIIANLVGGWTLCILHLLPEYLVFGGMQYLILCVYAHFFLTPKERPEPLFPEA
jgi:CDP-diacylglycerol--serine O-phosphatidyltransferase